MLKLKDSLSLALYGLFLVAAISYRSAFEPRNLSTELQSEPSTPLMMRGITPPHKCSSPSLAAMCRGEGIRDFLVGKTDTVYIDLPIGTPQMSKAQMEIGPRNTLSTFGTPISDAQYARLQQGQKICEPLPSH